MDALPHFPNCESLIRACLAFPPLPAAVVHPCDEVSLRSVVGAAVAGIIAPTLVGPEGRIRTLAKALGLDIGAFPIVSTPHSHASAAMGVAVVRAGKAQALVKGSLHTNELMTEVVEKQAGLRTGRRMSHVFVIDTPSYPKPLFVTDSAINIAPSLEDKIDIVQNAIDLARALHVERPKVAILSATEMVASRIPSTIDAAALCKMAERGQITGATLDGPLALDNAISRSAVATKHIVSGVAGLADILVAPTLEAGNILAKELTFLSGADAAGVVVGGRVPIVLTSRADNMRTHMASCAIAALYARALHSAAGGNGE